MLQAVAFTLIQLQSAECNIACHFTGYDAGYFQEKNCLCIDKKDYEELTQRKRIVLPKRSKPSQTPGPVHTVSAFDYMPSVMIPND